MGWKLKSAGVGSAEASDCMCPFAVDYTYVVFAGKDGTGRPVTSVSSRPSESGKAADVLARLGPGLVRFAAVRDGRAATACLAVKSR